MNDHRNPPESSLLHTEDLVKAFIVICENRGLSPRTLKQYRQKLMAFAKLYPVLPARPEPIEEFVHNICAGDETRLGYYRCLKAFYNVICLRHGLDNPFRYIRQPQATLKEKAALTLEQLKKLLDYPHEDWVKTLLLFLADTGCRIGEAANLTVEDIFPDTVRLNGKTGQRIIPITPFVRESLLKLSIKSWYENIPGYEATGSQSNTIFRWHVTYLRKKVKAAMLAAGLRGFSAHSLRHSFATLWDGSDTALKYITGHKSWAMIENYKHRREAQASEQHKLHSPLAKIYGKDSNTSKTLPEHHRDIDVLSPDLAEDIYYTKYIFHSLLSNISKRLEELFDEFARTGRINELNVDWCGRELVDHLFEEGILSQDEKDDRDGLSDEVISQESRVTIDISKKFWKSMRQLAGEMRAEQYVLASNIRNNNLLEVPETAIEEIVLLDMPLLWAAVN